MEISDEEHRDEELGNLRELLDSTPQVHLVRSADGGSVLWVRMFGHPRSALLDRGLSALIPAHLHGELRARRAGRRAAFELLGLRRDGSTFPIEMTVALLETEEGRLWSSAIRDVSERKLTESALTAANAALQIAKESADAANRAKSAFLANMSHEIRTPMNAILGYTQLLQRDPELGPKQLDRLAIVARSGEHLLDLINDVLEMSKIEAGHSEVSRANVDVQALVGDLTRMFRLRADDAGLLFAVRCDDALPPYVMGDERKLRQVLVNLLGNAVRPAPTAGCASPAARPTSWPRSSATSA